ncbi:hypothetical protein GW17_00009272 [Ensete ventricosum]|nr:hypothetical protein GW17_00009272 [Ensete ventricosum]RZR77188.1 hypothetical protein BHM03_00002198 [Ensete ventricosum]
MAAGFCLSSRADGRAEKKTLETHRGSRADDGPGGEKRPPPPTSAGASEATRIDEVGRALLSFHKRWRRSLGAKRDAMAAQGSEAGHTVGFSGRPARGDGRIRRREVAEEKLRGKSN